MFGKSTAALLGCLLSIAMPTFPQAERAAHNSALRQAEELYGRAEYQASLSRLPPRAADSRSFFLIGRDYYMLADFKNATKYLAKAVIAAPDNSECVDWLGRAYSMRAEISNPVSAVILAKKAKAAFERAVTLNPGNAEALFDLFHYYLDAPAVLGGGREKAENVAKKMWAANPDEALSEQWQLGQRGHRSQTANEAPVRATSRAPMPASTLVASMTN